MLEAAARFLPSRESVALLGGVSAKRNPAEYTEDERMAISMANRLLRLSDKKTAFSKTERGLAFTKISAMIREFEAPSWWLQSRRQDLTMHWRFGSAALKKRIL